jgi:hypothetical protein
MNSNDLNIHTMAATPAPRDINWKNWIEKSDTYLIALRKSNHDYTNLSKNVLHTHNELTTYDTKVKSAGHH